MSWIPLSAIAIALACGCSGQSATPTSPEQPATVDAPPPPTVEPTEPAPKAITKALIEEACTTVIAIDTRDQCGIRFDWPSCVSSLQSEAETLTGWERDLRVAALECVAAGKTCNAMSACFTVERKEIIARRGPRQCGDDLAAPIRLDAEEAAGRRGESAAKFSDVAATHEKPVEVCGLTGELEWLQHVSCDDGSKPFSSRDEAHRARVGNTGRGGRCKSTIDHYRVPCPEKTYSIHIDMYMCGPGEEF